MDPRKIRWRTKLLRVTASSSPAPGVFVTDLRVIACLLDCALIAGFSLVAFAPLLSVRSRLVVWRCFCSCLFCALYITYVAALGSFRSRTLGKTLGRISVARGKRRRADAR